jgi:hypothetical protein
MANRAFFQALAIAFAFAHAAACSPAPNSGETAAATPEQFAPAVSGSQANSPADPVVSPASAYNANITFKDESLSFVASFPDAPPNDPVIAELQRDAEGYLASLKTNARADFDRMKKGGFEARPWDVRVHWKYSAKASDMVSLIGEASEYTGGAHPNLRFDTHIARTIGAEIAFGDMLIAKRSPSPAMTIAICEALKTAKLAKIKSATILDEPIVCVGPDANAKTDDARVVLAPSNIAGRFGGVYVYYEPYAVGAYVEGPYIITVQQEIFGEDLRPEFKSLFGGEAPVLKN